MKIMTKIVGMMAEFGALYGLYSKHIIDGQSALIVGMVSVVFVLVIMDFASGFEWQIERVGRTVGSIAMYIVTRDGLQAGYFSTGSPIVLTMLGRGALEESGARKIVDSCLGQLVSVIEATHPKNELDVRSRSFSLVEELLNSDRFSSVKNFVFQHPKYPDADAVDFNLPILTDLMSVYLTDEYLRTHPLGDDRLGN